MTNRPIGGVARHQKPPTLPPGAIVQPAVDGNGTPRGGVSQGDCRDLPA